MSEGAGPWGHSASAHAVLGFCSHCAGRTTADEVVAWRTVAQLEHLAVGELRVADKGGAGRTVSLDFDGVLHSYHRGYDDGTVYGTPLPGSREAVAWLLGGFAVVVTTSRSDLGAVAQAIRRWYDVATIVDEAGRFEFWSVRGVVLVTRTKMPAVAYVDDRAVLHAGEWPQTLDEFAGRYGAMATPGPPRIRPTTGGQGETL